MKPKNFYEEIECDVQNPFPFLQSRCRIAMSNQWLKILVFSLCGCLGVIPPATAEMMSSWLRDVLTLSKTVIQGECIGLNRSNQIYQLDVKKVLRGQMALGQQAIPYVHGQTPSSVGATPCLAFLNQKGQLQYLAVPTKAYEEQNQNPQNSSLEMKGLLKMIGFYDYFDSHIVSPGVVSLTQLETYFKTGKLTYIIRGKLHFFSPYKQKITPSNIVITGTYEVLSDTSTVQGLSIVKGFSQPPRLVDAGMFLQSPKLVEAGILIPEFVIKYGDEKSERFLGIGSTTTRIDPTTGSIEANFWVSYPLIYKESDFRHYIANANLTEPYERVSIIQKNGTRWTLTFNKKGDPDYGVLSGFRNQSFMITFDSSDHLSSGFQDRIEVPLNGNGTLVLAVDPTKLSEFLPRSSSLPYSSFPDLPLFQTLMKESIECKVRVDGGTEPMQPTPCRLELDSIQFNTVSSQKRL